MAWITHNTIQVRPAVHDEDDICISVDHWECCLKGSCSRRCLRRKRGSDLPSEYTATFNLSGCNSIATLLFDKKATTANSIFSHTAVCPDYQSALGLTHSVHIVKAFHCSDELGTGFITSAAGWRVNTRILDVLPKGCSLRQNFQACRAGGRCCSAIWRHVVFFRRLRCLGGVDARMWLEGVGVGCRLAVLAMLLAWREMRVVRVEAPAHSWRRLIGVDWVRGTRSPEDGVVLVGWPGQSMRALRITQMWGHTD